MATDTIGREVPVRLPTASDPAPARRLCELLRQRRASGHPWPSAAEYNRLVTIALAFTSCPHERVEWRAVLASQRDVWRRAYERELVVRWSLAVG